MKILLKVLLVLTTSISLAQAKCKEERILVKDQKEIKVCFDKKDQSYLSENCSSVKECFLKKKIIFKMYPNQSPGFSLCYQLEGTPFFAEIKKESKTIPFCELNSFFVDQESLAKAFLGKK